MENDAVPHHDPRGTSRSIPLPPVLSAEEYSEINALQASGFARSYLAERVSLASFDLWKKAVDFDGVVSRLSEDRVSLGSFYEDYNRLDSFRVSLLTLSATILISDDTMPSERPMVARAARLVRASLDFYDDARSGGLDPERVRGRAQDPSQYESIFGSHTIPGARRDAVRRSRSETIVVGVRGNFYECRVVGPDGCRLSVGAIERLLVRILEDSKNREPRDTGFLSAAERGRCFAARQVLRYSRLADSLYESIDSALFFVALDESATFDATGTAARHVHCGDVANRWYELGLQIVLSGDGSAGFVFNHRNNIGGNAMARFASEVAARSREVPREIGAASSELPRHIGATIPAGIVRFVRTDVDSVVVPASNVGEVRTVGRLALKERALAADGTVQLVVQLAAKRLLGRSVCAVEWINMGHFMHVGLEAGVTSFPEMRAAVDACVELGSGDRHGVAEARARIMTAVERHGALVDTLRRGMPLKHVVEYASRKATGLRSGAVHALAIANRLILGRPDVMTSHPQLRDEVVVFGRPGVRLPYLDAFGLHYQLRADRLEYVLAPSTRTEVTLEAFDIELRRGFDTVLRLVDTRS